MVFLVCAAGFILVLALLALLGFVLSRRGSSPDAPARNQDIGRSPESYAPQRPGDWPGQMGS